MAGTAAPAGALEKLLAHLRKNGKDTSWEKLSQRFHPKGNKDWARTAARMKGFNTTTNQFDVEKRLSLQSRKKKTTGLSGRVAN